MRHEKYNITVKGKSYGYWTLDGVLSGNIRSEDNPDKTPYLKEGSKKYLEVRKAIIQKIG